MPSSVQLVNTPSGKLVKYNGRLVRAIERGLVYHTDFSRLDLTTGIDIPKYGLYGQWAVTGQSSGVVESTTVTIDGVEHSCLHMNGPTSSSTEIYNTLTNFTDYITPNDHLVTIEATVYKPSYTGTWGGLNTMGGICPYYNCWSSDRGLGVWATGGTSRTLYHNYSCRHDSGGWYNDAGSNVVKVATCGISKIGNVFKYYVNGEKAMTETRSSVGDSVFFYASATSSGWGGGRMEYYVLEFKIYKNRDKFEEMA